MAKLPTDINQKSKRIVDILTGSVEKPREKDAAAVELGRKGGLKGGVARAESLTKEERSKAATKAAEARWKKKD